jgi:hypothetical protein
VSKYEILPPTRSSNLPAARPVGPATLPARVNPGGIIESALTRWEAARHARTIDTLTTRTRAETELYEAQAQLVESYVKRQRAAQRFQELPEILATDYERRRAERAEELREVHHRHDVAETRRRSELAQAETALVDAQQALQAQHHFGYSTYELAWKKRKCEMLDVDLSAAERRAILRQHLAELEGSRPAELGRQLDGNSSDDVIDNALVDARAQLNANGLDTTRVDAVIERRKAR